MHVMLKQITVCYSQCAGSDDKFWAHEYNYHGTCNINDLSELEYFNAVLELNNNFGIDVSRHSVFSVCVAYAHVPP